LHKPFISYEADSGDEQSDDEYSSSTDKPQDLVPLVSRSEPSRLDTLLDKIQDRSQAGPSTRPASELDVVQVHRWLEENYGATLEVPGYEVFALKCKVSFETCLNVYSLTPR
jgi:hypothetical protein